MAYDLILHPDCTCDAIQRIAVDMMPGPASKLSLKFTVFGEMVKLRIPAQAPSGRTDQLWQHTCFEAFIATSNDEGYLELNFSPSTQWAAYRFTGYREGMVVAEDIQQPEMDVQCDERLMVMSIVLNSVIPAQAGIQSQKQLDSRLRGNDDKANSNSLRLGLSAVIEERNGRKSYWALAHPPGKPDFHHRDGFLIDLS